MCSLGMKTFFNSSAPLRNRLPKYAIRRARSTKVAETFPKRIFSGIQPTGCVHLGNYFGAVQKWVELQDTESEVLFSVVDMHSITVPHEPKLLKDNILKMTATLIACGIDPKKCTLFQQSAVSMHAELAWILGCITTMARLAHLPQYKEKSKDLKNVPLGLYIYPVLQCADILLYRATHVPIGQDQLHHLHLAQDLAGIFNKKFGLTFPAPKPITNGTVGHRIKSLRDITKKMSKSSTDQKSVLYLLDEPEVLLEKVKKAITDFTSEVTYEPETRLGITNLINIHCLFSGKTSREICQEAQGLTTAEYKLVLADVIVQKLAPIRKEYSKLIKEPAYLEGVLKEGAEKATEIATGCWRDVRNKVGFGNDGVNMNDKYLRAAEMKI